MTNYIISGYIGYDNFGDELIAEILCKHLKKDKNNNITVISATPKKTAKRYDVNSVPKLNFFSALLKSDILISSGGSLLQDITSSKSLFYYLFIIFLAIFLNKKVVIFAQGFTPFKSNINKLITQLLLKKCNKITVRDFQSQQLLLSMGINAEIVNDPAFEYKIPLSETKDKIGIQLRNSDKITTEFLKELAYGIKKEFGDKKLYLISLQDKFDLPILNEFAQILKNESLSYEIKSKNSLEDITKIFSELEYLIGMRYHACLIGSIARTKILGLNYDIKVATLSKDIGFPLYSFNQDNLSQKISEIKNIDTSQYKIPIFDFDKAFL